MKTRFQNKVILRLKKLREMSGLSQAAIASLLGISPGQLGNIESYKHPHKYTLSQIVKLCDKFQVSIEEIFFEKNEEVSARSLIDAIIKYQTSHQFK